MAVKKKAAPVAKKEAPRAYLLEMEPKQLHIDFAQYMSDETGEPWPSGNAAQDALVAVVLRGPFQASEINQQRLADAAAERENAVEARAAKAAEREAAQQAKEEAKAAKAAAPKAAKAAPKAPPTKAAGKGKLKPVPTPTPATVAKKKPPVRKGAASEAQF